MTSVEFLSECSFQKAQALYEKLQNDQKLVNPVLIIAADTMIVDNHGKMFGKPKSEADALATLLKLKSDVSHQVSTSVTLLFWDPKLGNASENGQKILPKR